MSDHTVLIVEDNPTNLMLVQDLLEVHGYRTLQVSDGGLVVDLVKEKRPDLVLMDIQLPTMDGYSVTRALRADQATRGVPVIALTSFAMKDEEQKAAEAGCNGYLSKPIDIHRLIALVRENLPE